MAIRNGGAGLRALNVELLPQRYLVDTIIEHRASKIVS